MQPPEKQMVLNNVIYRNILNLNTLRKLEIIQLAITTRKEEGETRWRISATCKRMSDFQSRFRSTRA